MHEIHLGDCLDILPTLPDNSVDAVVSDPPYFKVKAEWWDRQWEKPREFLSWLDQVAEQWQRVLKPNGSLYCFASPKMAARVEVLLGERFNVVNRITWQKPPYATKAEMFDKETMRGFFPASESIIFCEHYGADNIAKGEAGYGAKCDELRGFVFEPLRAYLDGERVRAGVSVANIARERGCTETMIAQHHFSSSQWSLPTLKTYQAMQRAAPGYFTRPYEELRQQYEELRQQYEDLRQQYEDLRRPFNVTADVPYTDVWTFPTVSHYPGKHPCEKPAALLEHIIKSSTRPGAVVLDCFTGSGSTGAAAVSLGRNFIGIEIDSHWCAFARDRLATVAPIPPVIATPPPPPPPTDRPVQLRLF